MTDRSSFLTGVGLSLLACFLPRAADAQVPVSVNVPAPEIVGRHWLNTAKNQPIKLSDRRGKVTVVEFWTFG